MPTLGEVGILEGVWMFILKAQLNNQYELLNQSVTTTVYHKLTKNQIVILKKNIFMM